jgi:hypothetical protein
MSGYREHSFQLYHREVGRNRWLVKWVVDSGNPWNPGPYWRSKTFRTEAEAAWFIAVHQAAMQKLEWKRVPTPTPLDQSTQQGDDR